MRKIVRALAVLAVALGTFAVAPAAHAVPSPFDACNEFNIVIQSGVPITVHYPVGCNYDGYNVVGTVDYDVVNDAVNRNVTVTVWNVGEGYVWLSFNSVEFDGPNIIPCESYPRGQEPGSWDTYYIDCAEPSNPPPSWYQSVGRAGAEAVCAEGWTPSWAMWMNGGTGGYTCDREEYWNSGTEGWSYRKLANNTR